MMIKGELTDLNAFIKATNSHFHIGNKIKQAETNRVYYEAKEQKIKPVEKYPVHIKYTWYCKNNKKDIDNISFSKKFVNDGLVLAGVLKGDGRKYVKSFEDHFEIDKLHPRVEVEIL